jgi:F0F1-type ATP synthase membrane subunit a
MILFFGIFEGLIQAFVFAMLTLTYLSTAITHEFPEEQEGIP